MQNNEGLLWLSFFVITGLTTLQVGQRFRQNCAMSLGEGVNGKTRVCPPKRGCLVEEMSLFSCVSLRRLLVVLKKHRDVGDSMAWDEPAPELLPSTPALQPLRRSFLRARF